MNEELNFDEIRSCYYRLYIDYQNLSSSLQREMDLRQKMLNTFYNEITKINQGDKALNNNLNTMINSNLNRSHRLLEKLTKKSEECLQIKAKLRIANYTIEENEAEIEYLKSQLYNTTYIPFKFQNHNEEVIELQNSLDIANETISNLKLQLDEQRLKYQQLKDEFENKNEELLNKEKECIENRSAIVQLTQDLKETHQILIDQQKSVEDFLNTNKDSPWGFTKPLQAKIDQLEQELQNSKIKCEELQKEIEKQKETLVVPIVQQPSIDYDQIKSELTKIKKEITEIYDGKLSNVQNNFNLILDQFQNLQNIASEPAIQITNPPKQQYTLKQVLKSTLYFAMIVLVFSHIIPR